MDTGTTGSSTIEPTSSTPTAGSSLYLRRRSAGGVGVDRHGLMTYTAELFTL
jgi:hypothetical protein